MNVTHENRNGGSHLPLSAELSAGTSWRGHIHLQEWRRSFTPLCWPICRYFLKRSHTSTGMEEVTYPSLLSYLQVLLEEVAHIYRNGGSDLPLSAICRYFLKRSPTSTGMEEVTYPSLLSYLQVLLEEVTHTYRNGGSDLPLSAICRYFLKRSPIQEWRRWLTPPCWASCRYFLKRSPTPTGMEEVTYPSLLSYLQVLLEEVTHIYRNGEGDLPLPAELSVGTSWRGHPHLQEWRRWLTPLCWAIYRYFLKRSPTSIGMEEVTYLSLLSYLQVLLEEVTHIYRNGGGDLPLSAELSVGTSWRGHPRKQEWRKWLTPLCWAICRYFLKRSPTPTGMEKVTYPSLLSYLQVLLEEVTHIYRNGGSDLPLSAELSAGTSWRGHPHLQEWRRWLTPLCWAICRYFLKRSPTPTGMEEVTYPSLLSYLRVLLEEVTHIYRNGGGNLPLSAELSAGTSWGGHPHLQEWRR